ncbi:MAG: DUF4199 domain-containing protein [Flavisolibacter sp.]|nr:DUF4199 domain-containing protein [Flavisolibacter sp.]
MQQETKTAHAIKWGVIIRLVYSVMLFLRYSMGASNPIMLGLWTFVGYITVLVLMLICGFQLRKKNGGFIEFREIFKYLFISVLIFEGFYAAFNFIYLTYVDPQFFVKLKEATENLMLQSNESQERIDQLLEKMDTDAASNTNVLNVLKSYLVSIAISGVFALIFSLIIKKNKDPFHKEQETFLQS